VSLSDGETLVVFFVDDFEEKVQLVTFAVVASVESKVVLQCLELIDQERAAQVINIDWHGVDVDFTDSLREVSWQLLELLDSDWECLEELAVGWLVVVAVVLTGVVLVVLFLILFVLILVVSGLFLIFLFFLVSAEADVDATVWRWEVVIFDGFLNTFDDILDFALFKLANGFFIEVGVATNVVEGFLNVLGSFALWLTDGDSVGSGTNCGEEQGFSEELHFLISLSFCFNLQYENLTCLNNLWNNRQITAK
jgi:hypothetical protein